MRGVKDVALEHCTREKLRSQQANSDCPPLRGSVAAAKALAQQRNKWDLKRKLQLSRGWHMDCNLGAYLKKKVGGYIIPWLLYDAIKE